MQSQSTIPFAGDRRIHVGLAVSNIEQSTKFYATLLACDPVKVRPGYAKFEPIDPSVNLSLHEVAGARPPGDLATHYGIQVKSTQAVQLAEERLRLAGYPTLVQRQTTCCYATQDKVWASDPDGYRWEVFVVLEPDAAARDDASTGCCAPAQKATGCCAPAQETTGCC